MTLWETYYDRFDHAEKVTGGHVISIDQSEAFWLHVRAPDSSSNGFSMSSLCFALINISSVKNYTVCNDPHTQRQDAACLKTETHIYVLLKHHIIQ